MTKRQLKQLIKEVINESTVDFKQNKRLASAQNKFMKEVNKFSKLKLSDSLDTYILLKKFASKIDDVYISSKLKKRLDLFLKNAYLSISIPNSCNVSDDYLAYATSLNEFLKYVVKVSKCTIKDGYANGDVLDEYFNKTNLLFNLQNLIVDILKHQIQSKYNNAMITPLF